MRGSGTLLLALDGVPVGLVVEADTLEGWVRRYDTRQLNYDVLSGVVAWPTTRGPRPTGSVASPDPEPVGDAHADYRRRVAACPIVRVEGKVDFIGDTATDPDWMIAQRLAAVRIRHGLPIDVSIAHDTGGMVASVLERLAAQLRVGSMAISNIRQSLDAEWFPLPDDKQQYLQTGVMHMTVDYVSLDKMHAYEADKAAWARANPDLVADHVRRCTEGEAKIVEEFETAAALRVQSAELRCRLRT